MSEQKGFFELLMDFSFQQMMTARYAKLLYALHLLAGLMVAVWQVFDGFQGSTAQGLLALLLAAVGYFLWILYVRIGLEFLVTFFRTSDAIMRSSGGSRDS